MPTEFKLPDIGEGLEEGEIVKWLVKPGDLVKEDQNIVQVETDKAVADLPSPASGKILKINFKEGDTVKVGEVLCVIGQAGEKVSSEKPVAKAAKPVAEPVNLPAGKKESSKKPEKTAEEIKEVLHAETMTGEAQTQKVLAAPAIRKLARSLKIDLSTIKGSGAGGKIVKKDLEQVSPENSKVGEPGSAVPQQKVSVKKKYDEYGYLERVPLKGIRKTIAQNMMKSLDGAAQLTAMEDIDVSKLWNLRKRERKTLEKKGIKLTFLPFIIKACVAALKENPILNSSIEGEEIIIKKYFNIGIAVETPVGLMVPVIKIAEDKNIENIAREIETLAEKARTRKIDIMDMKGGTFTITNYGSVGGTYGTPVLNPPEAGILGLGRIFDRAVLDKKGNLKNTKILPISLTFDHRILDGAQAARFLESLKIFLEDPSHLVMYLR